MKKIILSILGVVVIGGGAFLVKVGILDKPSDPQAFVNEALAKNFEISSAAFESKVVIEAVEIEGISGSADLTLSGKGNKLTKYLPEIDYSIDLNGSGTGLGQNINLKVGGDLRILDEVLYGKLRSVEVTGIPNEALMMVGAASAFTDRWYGLSFAKLKEADEEIKNLFDEQEQQQLAMRKSLKDFLGSQDVLTVEKVPMSFGDTQAVEVSLNTDVLASENFFNMLEELFTPQLPEGAENPFALDDKKRMDLQGNLQKIAEGLDSQITLQIGKKDGLLHGYSATINLNLGSLGVEEVAGGSVKILVNSKITGINQPQQIVAPADFEEIDPLTAVPEEGREDTTGDIGEDELRFVDEPESNL